MYAEDLFAWRCDRTLPPTYTSKLNTLLRRKFIIEFVPFGSQTYQLEFHLAGLISFLPLDVYSPRCDSRDYIE